VIVLIRLLLPALLLVLGWFGLKRLKQHYNLNGQQFTWLLMLSGVAAVVLILIVLGRLPIQAIMAPIAFLATFAMRHAHWLIQLLSVWRSRRGGATRVGGSGESAGEGESGIKTAWLSMTLDHRTADMDGTVRQGQFESRQLSSMDLPELVALATECRDDSDSLQLLEAYLDRRFPQWREQYEDVAGANGNAGHSSGANGRENHRRSGLDNAGMTEALALEILGLQRGAERKAITEAHRRLMQKLHPDRGGSDYLAKRINEARDYLLDHL
tara:strand:- start:16766 stop:17575 length:810 start_codon:yes stop_codon:yes gene_type:complete